MFGWLFNTLQHRLDVEEDEWRSLNRLRGELEPNFLHRQLLRVASKPVLFGGTIFILVSIFVLAAVLVDSKYWVVYYVSQFKEPDRYAYFSTLWSVQAAIAALVYPIVISFVTLLLDRRNNASATLSIYLHDSAATLAGLSALLLVAEMGLQYFWLPYISIEALMAWVVLDAIWFIVNIGLTIHFLIRTFEFIQPGCRFEVIRRYAVSVAWPREARYHLARHFFLSAVEAKLLPGPSYGRVKEGEPCVLLGDIGFDSGTPTVMCAHTKKRQLRDIRFRLLGWATKRWLKKANAFYSLVPREKKWGERSSDAVIVFPLDPFATYDEGNMTLCRVEGGTALSRVERLLIRLSFDFGASSEGFVELTVDGILLDAQAEAIASLRSGELEAFEQNVKRMLVLYESIVDASQVLDISGGSASLMAVADRNHWLERPMYEVWSRRFVDLFEAASNKLSLGEDYVSVLTYIPNRLFSSAQEKAVPEILKHFIALSPILLRRIEDWWVRTVEQQGLMEHTPCNSAVLRAPFYGVHDKVLREFVGAWESLKNHRILPERDDEADWKKVRQSAELLEAHLSHTLIMLFDCILRGDRNATEWFADVLVKWYGELRFRFERSHDYFFRKQYLLTIETIFNEWDEVERRVKVEGSGVLAEPQPFAVLAACLNNLWADSCCIAIYVLATWNKDCTCDKSLPAQILSALVKGRPLRYDGHADERYEPYSSANELLLAILRQLYADGHYRRGYRNRLDKYLEQIAGLSQPDMVSGRIYSRWGSNDLDSVRDGQLLALLLAVPLRWDPSHEIEIILDDWVKTENEKVREFERMLNNWKTRLHDTSFSELMDSYECLRSTAETGIEFEAAKLSLGVAIEDLLGIAAKIHVKALADTSPSARRLLEIGQWASEKAFIYETAAFPIPLFGEIVQLGEPLADRSLVIKGMKKGELTDPPMADRVGNEKEWFADIVRDHAGSTVLAAVLDELKPENLEVNTPEAYWAQIKKYATEARAEGLSPALLLENPTLPGWVWDWVHPLIDETVGTAPADLVVSKDVALKIDGYRWSFNDIPVFNAPIHSGASVLIVRESFERVEFSRLPDCHYVKAVTRDVQEHPELVDLVLTWQMRISVKRYPAIRLSYDGQGRRRRTHKRV